MAHMPFVLRYRSMNGSHGRKFEQFTLRYLRVNGNFEIDADNRERERAYPACHESATST
jgi:hypothetical protein